MSESIETRSRCTCLWYYIINYIIYIVLKYVCTYVCMSCMHTSCNTYEIVIIIIIK